MKGTRIPDGWRPSEELLAWTRQKRPDLDLQDTLESFTDFWKAKTGQGATKLDWDATWRNWVRNTRGPYWNRPHQPTRPAQTYQPQRPGPERKTKVERLGRFLSDMFSTGSKT